MSRAFDKLVAFLSSNGLATILLLLLLLLTFLGTIEQTDKGIFEVQEKYFTSLYVVTWLFDTVPIPLPGAYLVLVLLCVNLVVGGILKVRFRPSRLGLFIAHFGVIFLLVAGFFTYQLSDRGMLLLFEGQEGAQIESGTDWEVAIWPVGDETREVEERLVPWGDFRGLDADEARTFRSPDLPFDLVLSGYLKNCRPRVASARPVAGSVVVGGFQLEALEPEKQAEANMPGLHVIVRRAAGGEEEALLWGRPGVSRRMQGQPDRPPLVVSTEQGPYAIQLRKREFNLDFRIRLEKFTFEQHPGTGMPSMYRSDVTMMDTTDGGRDVERQVRIQMNEPLRHEGFTLYQSTYGQVEFRGGTRMYSGFSVVSNPAEALPMWATLVIALGLVLHFGRKLYRYLRQETARRSS